MFYMPLLRKVSLLGTLVDTCIEVTHVAIFRYWP